MIKETGTTTERDSTGRHATSCHATLEWAKAVRLTPRLATILSIWFIASAAIDTRLIAAAKRDTEYSDRSLNLPRDAAAGRQRFNAIASDSTASELVNNCQKKNGMIGCGTRTTTSGAAMPRTDQDPA